MGKGGRKSRRKTRFCDAFETEQAADKCGRKVNEATMRDGLCRACWQKANAKMLNHRRNVWSFEGSKKKLMLLPISQWPEVK